MKRRDFARLRDFGGASGTPHRFPRLVGAAETEAAPEAPAPEAPASVTPASVTPASVTLEEAAQLVLRDLLMRHFSRYSIRNVRLVVRRFGAFLSAQGVERLDDVTPGLVESYQLALFEYRRKNGKALSLRSVQRHLADLKTWGRSLVRLGYIDRSPCEHLETPRLPRAPQDPVPSEDEVARIVQAPETRTSLGYRDRTILELLYGSGIRVGELCDLDICDVDLARATVTVRDGKCGSAGTVPTGPVAAEYLDGYIRTVRGLFAWKGEPRSALFLGGRGERMTSAKVEAIVAAAAKRASATGAKVERRVTPHTLRAAAASHMLARGADLRTVQEYLRHRSITATQHYLRMSGDRTLAEVHARFHPRNRM